MKKKTILGDALILTVSDQIEQLDYLLENLPDICCHIAAPVQFSEKICKLETKYNVRLMTVTSSQQIDFLVNMCDFLLDINHFQEVDSIVSKFVQAGKTVLAFDNTAKKIEKWQWITAPIRVGRDCWIGSNVTILKGVTIEDNTIIEAGCLIRNDVPANSVVYNDGNLCAKRRE